MHKHAVNGALALIALEPLGFTEGEAIAALIYALAAVLAQNKASPPALIRQQALAALSATFDQMAEIEA